MLEYAVIGAGPAGVQMGLELLKRGRKFALIEKADHAGAFFDAFPRHRRLLSINKVHTGYERGATINERWDWNSLLGDDDDPCLFSDFSHEYYPDAEKLVEYINHFVDRHNIPVEYNREVSRISKPEDSLFRIQTNSGTIEAGNVVVATGRSLPNRPTFEGIEHCEDYTDFDIGPDRFNSKAVVIVGKGNSAFETADSLIPHASTIHIVAPSHLQLAWRSHYVGHLRAVNNNFLDTFQLKSQNGLMAAEIKSVTKRDDGRLEVFMVHTNAEGQERTIVCDHVITATGFKFDASIFDGSCMPELDEHGRFPVLNADWSSTNVDGLYFAGTLMHQLDYRKSFSGFIHGFRYNVRALAAMLEETRHGVPWPADGLEYDETHLARKILERLNITTALFQQPGLLCDCYVIDHESSAVSLRPNSQVHYELDMRGGDECRLLATLEFGASKPDPFSPDDKGRFPFSKGGEHSTLIHPVIRYYRGNSLLAEHHVHQTLSNCWEGEYFLNPLTDFLKASVLEREYTAAQ